MGKEAKLEKILKNKKISKKLNFCFRCIIIAFVAAMAIAIGGFVVTAIKYDCSWSIGLIIALVIIAVILTVMCAIFGKTISKSLREPIYELKDAANKLSKGDLDFDIEYESKDELGQLAGDFRKALSNLKAIVGDSGVILNSMASGNFTVDSEIEDGYVTVRAVNAGELTRV